MGEMPTVGNIATMRSRKLSRLPRALFYYLEVHRTESCLKVSFMKKDLF